MIEANDGGEHETGDIEWELLNLNIGYVKAFGEYDGSYLMVLMVKGNNLDELIPNAAIFLNDIEVISEIYEC